ncbi:MAG: GDP-mannose 4,6-dehydratase [Pseudomonadota bacterium]
MTLLVTGGAGFIGNRVIREALARGERVVNADLLTYAASLSSVWDLEEEPGYTLETIDITDAQEAARLFATHAPRAVIHLAAETDDLRSRTNPLHALGTNVLGTATLLEAARVHWESVGRPDGFRFLHASAPNVKGSRDVWATPQGDQHYAPEAPQAASKASADHLVQSWFQAFGLPTLMTRATDTYGPWQNPEKLIPRALTQAALGDQIEIFGDGQQTRDWLHVDDHARAIFAVLDGGTPGQSYGVATGNELRDVDLVRALCRQLQLRRPQPVPYSQQITHLEDRPGIDQASAPVDAGPLRRDLGWAPRLSFDQGLAATIDWYVNHASWWKTIVTRRDETDRARSHVGPGPREAVA